MASHGAFSGSSPRSLGCVTLSFPSPAAPQPVMSSRSGGPEAGPVPTVQSRKMRKSPKVPSGMTPAQAANERERVEWSV